MRVKIYNFLTNNFPIATVIFVVLLFGLVLELMFKPTAQAEGR